MEYDDDAGKERNRIALERVAFHLREALRFCSILDLSGLGPAEQKEWHIKVKWCKDSIGLTRESLKELNQILG